MTPLPRWCNATGKVKPFLFSIKTNILKKICVIHRRIVCREIIVPNNQRPNPPKWVNTPLQNYKPHSILVEKLEEPKECYTTSSTLPKICKRKLRS
nr:MAG TPA: hypothetical protein [Caudoviricetes sp.]